MLHCPLTRALTLVFIVCLSGMDLQSATGTALHPETLPDVERKLHADPDNLDLLHAKGAMQRQALDDHGAIATYERILTLTPDDVRARNLLVMAGLKTPIICTVIGEGGSGGALAIGVGDQTLMLQYSTYSVISPEGCASILWKSAEKASEAAEALGITSGRLHELGMVDRIVPEPLGGAHRNVDAVVDNVNQALVETLGELQKKSLDELLEARYQRLQAYRPFTDR